MYENRTLSDIKLAMKFLADGVVTYPFTDSVDALLIRVFYVFQVDGETSCTAFSPKDITDVLKGAVFQRDFRPCAVAETFDFVVLTGGICTVGMVYNDYFHFTHGPCDGIAAR